MNRWNLSKEVHDKYYPIVKEFLAKLEGYSLEELETLNQSNFKLDLSDTTLNPSTLKDLLEKLGYEEDEMDTNGWQMDFWIDMNRTDNKTFPSGCEKLQIIGTGMTFELAIVVKDFA